MDHSDEESFADFIMSLQVLPLTIDHFPALIRHADVSPPGDDCVAPPNPVAWPVTTAEEAQTRVRCAFALQKRRFNDSSVRFIRVVDNEETIAVARWHYYLNGYDYTREAHWEIAPDTLSSLLSYMDDPVPYPPSNFNVAMHNRILSDRDAFRMSWIPRGAPCWILMHLVTRPSHRRRGAAALLIEWGMKKAEETGVSAYLEAGTAGKPVYERFGFRQVGSSRQVDLREVGGGQFELANMVFHPEGHEG